MAYNFQPFKTASEGTLEWLKREFASLRTGRATPAILDSILVDAYDSKMKVDQVASVSMEDPKTLRVTPWDAGLAKAIEVAISQSSLGLGTAVDDKGLRVIFPELSSERRESLIKLSKQKLEEARIKLRTEREKILNDLEKKEKNDELSKDERFRLRNDLQKLVDEMNKKFEELAAKKEKEILE